MHIGRLGKRAASTAAFDCCCVHYRGVFHYSMNIGTNIVAVMSAQLRVVDRACCYLDLLECLPKQVAAPAIDITRNRQTVFRWRRGHVAGGVDSC
jgi:hypothetical protein